MLQRVVDDDPTVQAEWMFIGPTTKLWPATMFPFSRNYTLEVSATARRLVGRAAHFDVLFLHTQTLSLFLGGVMRRVPTVISVDATPMNIDEAWSWHEKGNRPVEAVKRRLVGSALRRAAYVMPWNDWCARSLVDDYGVAPARARLVLPGTDVESWGAATPDGTALVGAGTPPDSPTPPNGTRQGDGRGPLRVLFVGGAFERKGGPDLLSALKGLEGAWECDIVTKSEVPGAEVVGAEVAGPGAGGPGPTEARAAGRARVRAHRHLDQGDPRLRTLFAAADVFVLPTAGETMGFAIIEAMAAGLPVISTRVGAVPEVVDDGTTGILVPPGDVAALTGALKRLAEHPELRREMGAAGRRRARQLFDERVNGPRVLELLKTAADAGPRAPTGG
jgi:glycosyltransferase involved in cell wall biosynthesis